MNLLVHVHHIVLAEALVIVLTILIVLSILAVEPENINREAKLGEIVVAFDHLMGRVELLLREVVAERVHGWHWCVASQLTQLLLELLGVAFGTHQVELESVAL